MKQFGSIKGTSHPRKGCWHVKSLFFFSFSILSFSISFMWSKWMTRLPRSRDYENMLVWWGETDLYKHTKFLSHLLTQPTYRDVSPIQLESNMSPWKLSLYKLHTFSVVIIIWNLSDFRKELSLQVDEMCSAYWIVATCGHNRGVTWNAGLSLLILATTLLRLQSSCLVKVKIKYFWFLTWRRGRSVTWFFWVGLPHPKSPPY